MTFCQSVVCLFFQGFEDNIRKNRTVISNWIKYAQWEESLKEIQRYCACSHLIICPAETNSKSDSFFTVSAVVHVEDVSILKQYWPVLLRSFCYSRILHRSTHASVVFPHHCFLWFQGSFHLRASAGCRSPKHHPVAEVCRDGDEEPPGEPLPQHLGQSHHHPPTSQPVLVRMTLIYTAMTSGLHLLQFTHQLYDSHLAF